MRPSRFRLAPFRSTVVRFLALRLPLAPFRSTNFPSCPGFAFVLGLVLSLVMQCSSSVLCVRARSARTLLAAPSGLPQVLARAHGSGSRALATVATTRFPSSVLCSAVAPLVDPFSGALYLLFLRHRQSSRESWRRWHSRMRGCSNN